MRLKNCHFGHLQFCPGAHSVKEKCSKIQPSLKSSWQLLFIHTHIHTCSETTGLSHDIVFHHPPTPELPPTTTFIKCMQKTPYLHFCDENSLCEYGLCLHIHNFCLLRSIQCTHFMNLFPPSLTPSSLCSHLFPLIG